MFTIVPIAAVDPAMVEALLDTAFGTARHGRTAYRLREGVAALPDLSFAALDAAGSLAGSVQCWPVEIDHADGGPVPLVLVGPVAVRPDLQGGGIGRALTEAALAAADAAGIAATMLIGDPEYYGRFFGFDAAPTAGWTIPGPVERRRLLARLAPGAVLPAAGEVRAARVQLGVTLA
ncbi:GNAT family N-acetyltransferase [Sphingomonas jatrophae]|uniref:Predicted N-acetyltransferase YhbS n=1 Tax=Sphingomonas jatrophae TaxID=1166337 RepID=A0A1I6M693_9SPHN|nr:N-acetyltransferase [Sphingomonas jatrophae]SFS11128.1 Predicted N-acetyltransferase YhbS [Sphingomonas jatrophae]